MKVRKVKKKSIFNKIEDEISEKIDEVKNKDNNKRNANNRNNNYKNKNNYYKSKNSNNKNKNKNKNSKNKNKRSIFKKILTFILILGIIGVISTVVFLGYIVATAPEFNESDLTIKDQTVVYDIEGNIIATLGTQKRESVSYDELPQVLIDAIIATEDSRFFQHNGVDLFRFVKATVLQLVGKDEAGGASTLTMQTVKNRITKKDTIESNPIKKIIRKFQDVYLSVFKMEKEYSKEQILEFYVNDNFLGGSYYGVEEASKYYFGKSVSELTLPEASMIAGLFQLPGANNPYKNIEGATKRRSLVLQYMVNHNYITAEEKKLAEKVSIESLLTGDTNKNSAYQGYIDTVTAEVIELTGNDPAVVPMKIYTTMEKSIQDGINNVLNDNDAWYWRTAETTAGIAIVNAENGTIAAVGSGRNKVGERVFNNATQAKRQPGSTAKPIFDYGPAIEYNNFSTYTLLVDEPWTYTNGPSINNWDGGFKGLQTAKEHLMQSRNIPALKTFQQVGTKNSQKFAYSLGLDVALNSSSENYRIINEKTGLDNAINEAYAIGGVAEGFTPLEMATAYACFANGGYYTKAHSVTKIEYRETGEVEEFKYTKERVMKDSTAYIINNILESAVSGGGFDGGSYTAGSHVAAKTGTTNFDEATMKAKGLPDYAVNDLWTIAYTSKYSVAVWYGYEKVTSTAYNVNTGGHKESFVRSVMKYIPKDTTGWSRPSSVVEVSVEKETWPAALPSEYTPKDMITSGLFVRGTQPTDTSNRYAKLNDVKNVKTTKNGNSVLITWDYTTPEVLTTDYIQKYFNKSTFGNSKEKLAKERISYNKNTLGDIVFAIYKEDTDGKLTLVGTSDTFSYTYNGYGETNLVIKAEHGKFKANASSGVNVKLSLDEQVFEQLTATLSGSITAHPNTGNYKEAGFKSIRYGKLDVLDTATIKYQVNNGDIFTTKTELETYVNSLPAGTYTITYTVSYLTQELTKTRTVIIS